MEIVHVKKKAELRSTVRLPDDVHRAAKIASAHRDELIQEFIAEAVRIRIRALGMADLLKDTARRPSHGEKR
jgi:hypothetical protein